VDASQKERFTKKDDSFYITEDKETGCKYLIYDYPYKGGITPLLKSDGTVDCPDSNSQ
jgi:hypothetical protein